MCFQTEERKHAKRKRLNVADDYLFILQPEELRAIPRKEKKMETIVSCCV